jgi:hypothetical protein
LEITSREEVKGRKCCECEENELHSSLSVVVSEGKLQESAERGKKDDKL